MAPRRKPAAPKVEPEPEAVKIEVEAEPEPPVPVDEGDAFGMERD